MAATNFDAFFCIARLCHAELWKRFPAFHGWLQLLNINSCHKIFLRLHLNDTFGNTWIERGGPIACPRAHLTGHHWISISGGTWKPWCTRLAWRHKIMWSEYSRSWSHPWYARNLSKSSAWHKQAIHKLYRSWWRPYWARSVSEQCGVYWQYFKLFPLLLY